MKVYIGPYVSWIGPYQLAKLPFLLKNDQHRFGSWLEKTFIGQLCTFLHNRKKQKIKIKIDGYDIWNAEYTMALVILPVLQRLAVDKHGACSVDNEDVPTHLHNLQPDTWSDTDEHWFDRWTYVLNEMIWAFGEMVNGEENEPDISAAHSLWTAYQERLENGFRLFGKYYRGMWT